MKPQVFIKDDFKNLLEYQAWVKEVFENLSTLNIAERSKFERRRVESLISQGWYGRNVSYSELAEGVKEYKRPELLDALYQKVSHEVAPVLQQKLKARKMKFNALGFGMFCFDRAAMTMYRNHEFYSASKKILLDAKEVKNVSGGYIRKTDGSKVIMRWEEKPDGSPKIRTNTKDLFAYFPEVPRDRHSVEFFLFGGGAAKVKAEDMLYAGVSAVIMAELLIKAGIRVKINMVIGSSTSSDRNEFYGCVIPLKQYDETLDRNIIALLSSDPRFFRYDGFKGIIAAYEHFKTKVPFGYGYALSASQFKHIFEKSGYAKKSQAAHRYYFGGTFSESAALQDINETIEDIVSHLKK